METGGAGHHGGLRSERFAGAGDADDDRAFRRWQTVSFDPQHRRLSKVHRKFDLFSVANIAGFKPWF